MKRVITFNKSIKQAIIKMNNVGTKCLVILDKNSKFLGTLSDGDIRKSLIKGKDLKSSIRNIYNKKSKFFYKNQFSLEKAKKILINKNFDLIPLIDKNKKLIDIYDYTNIFNKELPKQKLNTFAVIMSGGKGKRLEPFTKILPKPLVPIKDTPIIDIIMEKFLFNGINKFYFSVNYKSEILKAYLRDQKKNYKVNFIEEKKPLGTAGSLSYFANKKKTDFIVSNCDIILKKNYSQIFNFHKKNKNDITIVVSKKKYTLPYGSCNVVNDKEFINIDEKPSFNFLINTGFYIINSKVLSLIPKNKEFDFTDLISKAKKRNKKILVYKVSEKDWIDIGQWPEYKKALNHL